MKIPIFPGKYHQNGGFSMAMLVYRRVPEKKSSSWTWCTNPAPHAMYLKVRMSRNVRKAKRWVSFQSWESKGGPPPQEIAGPNKALLRETNG